MKIYADGSGWNGHESKICVYIGASPPIVLVERIMARITNNEAEYTAVTRAIERAENGSMIYTDSQLVIGQVNKGWKVNAKHLQTYIDTVKYLLELKHCILIYVPREQNLAGKALEKLIRKEKQQASHTS